MSNTGEFNASYAVSENSHTVKHEKKRTKKQYINQYTLNNPYIKPSDIAQKANTSLSYVYNVISESKKSVRSERYSSKRYGDFVSGHGLFFYEDCVPSGWYDALDVPVVNVRTGMKQVGFKKKGDPCTCQVHRGGRVIVFTHGLGWKDWLVSELKSSGWEDDQALLLINGLHCSLKVAEGGVKIPKGSFPKDFHLQTDWGFVVVIDDSPMKNTLEIKLNVPDLARFLGLPEIHKKLDLISASLKKEFSSSG